MIRIVIADDHAMVRAGLSQLLGSFDDLEVVGTASERRKRPSTRSVSSCPTSS